MYLHFITIHNNLTYHKLQPHPHTHHQPQGYTKSYRTPETRKLSYDWMKSECRDSYYHVSGRACHGFINSACAYHVLAAFSRHCLFHSCVYQRSSFCACGHIRTTRVHLEMSRLCVCVFVYSSERGKKNRVVLLLVRVIVWVCLNQVCVVLDRMKTVEARIAGLRVVWVDGAVDTLVLLCCVVLIVCLFYVNVCAA